MKQRKVLSIAVSNTSNRWGRWRESHGKRTDDKRYATLSDGGTAMSLYQIQATDEVVNGGRVAVKGETTSETQA
jgi:hypothetical protein